MLFVLGYITGMVTAALIVATLVYFKNPIERTLRHTQTTLENVAPRPRGFLFEAEDEDDIAREQLIARNAEQGKDTKLSELS